MKLKNKNCIFKAIQARDSLEEAFVEAHKNAPVRFDITVDPESMAYTLFATLGFAKYKDSIPEHWEGFPVKFEVVGKKSDF